LFSILRLVLPVLSIMESDLEVRWVVWHTTMSVTRSRVKVLHLEINGFIVPGMTGEMLSIFLHGSTVPYLVHTLKPVAEKALNRKCVAFNIKDAWSMTRKS
jgi:hypothetical protein